ncbi:MAG: hypothetical protein ABI577_13550 [bacterium]
MFGLGTREYVALAVLAVAAVMGYLFFDPTSAENNTGDKRPTVSLGIPVTSTPVIPPTPTPEPVHTLAQPKAQWYLVYYEKGVSGSDVKSGEGFVDGLDFDIADRPFLDFKPDAWSMQLSNSLAVEAGHNRFVLEVDGEAKVWIDGALVAQAANGDAPVKLPVEFEHKAGNAGLVIEVRDTGGPVRLRWSN